MITLYIFSMFLLHPAKAETPQVLRPAVNRVVKSIGCDNFESDLWDITYSAILDAKTPPARFPLGRIVTEELASIGNAQQQGLLQSVVPEFFRILPLRTIQNKNLNDQLENLTELEIGKADDSEAIRIQAMLASWRQELVPLKSLCKSNAPDNQPSVTSSVVLGANKAFAVAYQSCETSQLPPLDIRTPDLRGLAIVGFDGGGTIRHITNLRELLKSDPYYSNFRPSPQCYDLSKSPLLYNFGGKPFTTSSPDSSLNMFVRTGEGVSPFLGIDCSAYVFTSLANAGLRLSQGRPMKAILVHGINSNMFKSPANNGLSCLQKIKMGISGTLQAGDIIAKNGHVAIFNSVGADPLGLSRAKSEDDCDGLSSTGFDFVMIQSSSSKEGIGINKFVGKDYLEEEDQFKQGLETYATQACHAKFQKKDVVVHSSEIQVVRHMLSPDCRQAPIALDGAACVASCFNSVAE